MQNYKNYEIQMEKYTIHIYRNHQILQHLTYKTCKIQCCSVNQFLIYIIFH